MSTEMVNYLSTLSDIHSGMEQLILCQHFSSKLGHVMQLGHGGCLCPYPSAPINDFVVVVNTPSYSQSVDASVAPASVSNSFRHPGFLPAPNAPTLLLLLMF